MRGPIGEPQRRPARPGAGVTTPHQVPRSRSRDVAGTSPVGAERASDHRGCPRGSAHQIAQLLMLDRRDRRERQLARRQPSSEPAASRERWVAASGRRRLTARPRGTSPWTRSRTRTCRRSTSAASAQMPFPSRRRWSALDLGDEGLSRGSTADPGAGEAGASGGGRQRACARARPASGALAPVNAYLTGRCSGARWGCIAGGGCTRAAQACECDDVAEVFVGR